MYFLLKTSGGGLSMEFVNLTERSPSIFSRFIYRFVDIIVGIIGTLISILLFIFIKIAYIRDRDFFPIIFIQERIGKDGKLFKMYKFRTMIPNADQVLVKLMKENENIKKEYEINKKLENDPRITRIGHLLRKTSLDEFPQFFNVLKGDMTLIGPRPYLPREKEDMGNSYEIIIQCKPAITGLWQISGRNNINFNDRCEMDIYYIKNKNIKKDIDIFFKTLFSVIKKEGAK